MSDSAPDITNLPLSQLTPEQWENLCDHCGKCCLLKLEDMDDGRVYLTDIACKKYDMEKQACSCYKTRLTEVEDCVLVSLDTPDIFRDLPLTCAYRLRFENKPLLAWHPLVSGDKNSVNDALISIKDRAFSEEFIHPDEYGEHIIDEIV